MSKLKLVPILTMEDHYCDCTKQCSAIFMCLCTSCHSESFLKIEPNYFKLNLGYAMTCLVLCANVLRHNPNDTETFCYL